VFAAGVWGTGVAVSGIGVGVTVAAWTTGVSDEGAGVVTADRDVACGVERDPTAASSL
jgi:hypothetical protein